MEDSAKRAFVAKYGKIDFDKELSHDNENPNENVLLRADATREHALKLLYHPNEMYASCAMSAHGRKERLLKRSDLERYQADPKGHPYVKHFIKNVFDHEAHCKEVAGNYMNAAHADYNGYHFAPFAPEDQ